MTNYQRGRAFEYRVIKDLGKRGYVTIRAAQSKGRADVWAAKSDGDTRWLLFIQCKLNSAAVPPKDWNALCKMAEVAAAVPVLAVAGGAGNKKAYYILTALKDGRGGKQPMSEFQP